VSTDSTEVDIEGTAGEITGTISMLRLEGTSGGHLVHVLAVLQELRNISKMGLIFLSGGNKRITSDIFHGSMKKCE